MNIISGMEHITYHLTKQNNSKQILSLHKNLKLANLNKIIVPKTTTIGLGGVDFRLSFNKKILSSFLPEVSISMKGKILFDEKYMLASGAGINPNPSGWAYSTRYVNVVYSTVNPGRYGYINSYSWAACYFNCHNACYKDCHSNCFTC